MLQNLLPPAIVLCLAAGAARAADCPANHDKLASALKVAVKPSGGPSNGGLDNNEWAALVTRDGTVCAVAFSGAKSTDQWLASRAIAAEKANTVALKNFAVSTANLYAGSAPGGIFLNVATTNPVDIAVLDAGDPKTFGTAADPLVGHAIGGVLLKRLPVLGRGNRALKKRSKPQPEREAQRQIAAAAKISRECGLTAARRANNPTDL